MIAPAALRRLHPLDDELGRRLGERGEDAAGVEPAHAAGEDRLPVEVAGLEQAAGLVGAVVEDDRRADAVAAVAVDGGDVRPADAVVLEPLVERRDAHLADAGLHQLADGVVDHRRATPVFRPKQSARLAATLYSPPETWMSSERALRNGITPGSRRWTRAPRERKSNAQASVRIGRGMVAPVMIAVVRVSVCSSARGQVAGPWRSVV